MSHLVRVQEAAAMATAQHPHSDRTWQEIARELAAERDSTKILKLSLELDAAMLNDERQKIRQHLGPAPAQRQGVGH